MYNKSKGYQLIVGESAVFTGRTYCVASRVAKTILLQLETRTGHYSKLFDRNERVYIVEVYN